MRNYDKRMVGYMLEHPAVDEAASRLAEVHGSELLELHVIDEDEAELLAALPEAAVGDILWRTRDMRRGGIIKKDGTILPEEDRP